jgi:D-alanyl-D-alanine carboxypeptidase
MRMRGIGARGLRWGILALVAVVTITATAGDPADARRRRKFRVAGYNPPYAAIVVDANSGRVLHSANPDSIRHPASLTKIMTLYLLFEQIEAGKLRMDSELRVSSRAALQAPSKLGVRPGDTIEVEDAIKALVTKSANDVAVVIGEAIGGDEDDFARMMTRKARALGMQRTTYANASGLPNPEQVTTARDQALLGKAIQDRFPRLYRYFATPRFHFRGRTIGNHNRLLGRVEGVDGIKTGYIRASGFNLVSSMRRGDRHIVGVVLGGSSGRSRDARMRTLLEGHIREASARRAGPRATETAETSEPTNSSGLTAADRSAPRPEIAPRQEAGPLVLQSAPPAGSAEPIKPLVVRTVLVKRGKLNVAVSPKPSATEENAARLKNEIGRAGAKVASLGSVPIPIEPAAKARAAARSIARGEWLIQIGAYPAESAAQQRLKEAMAVGKSALGGAEPFTERVAKGDSTLYRARFVGFDKGKAEAACRQLKSHDFACLPIRN